MTAWHTTASAPFKPAAQRLRRHCRGAVGVEMALVLLPLMMFILGIIELGFNFYTQQALDFGLYTAVRQVATGNLQGTATSLATFKSVSFCPAIGSLLPCASISVTVAPATAFTSASVAVPMTNGAFDGSSYQYCPGQPGQMMMAQAVYPAPSFLLQYLSGGVTTNGGQTVRLISSTAGFVNEPFTATAAPPPGC